MSDTEKTTLARGNLQKLEDDGETNNYADWEWKMKIVLRRKKVWEYIEGPESNGPPPVPILDPGVNDAEVETAAKAQKTWHDGDLFAINIFAATLPRLTSTAVKHAELAKEMWKILRDEYRPVNVITSQGLAVQIVRNQCLPGKQVLSWLKRMREMYTALVDQDPEAMNEGGFKTALMHGVPRTESWAAFLRTLRADVTKMKKDSRADPTKKLQPMSAAMMVGRIREEATNQLANTPKAITEIYGLKAEKHTIETVLGAVEASTSKKPYIEKKCANTWCKRRGHLREDCYMYEGGKVGKYPDN